MRYFTDKTFIRYGLVVLIVLFFAVPAFSETAAKNYSFYCAQCHGSSGDGKGVNAVKELPVDPRDFTDPTALGILTDGEIVDIITNGGRLPALTTVMPPYKMTLTSQEILELKDFLRAICKCAYNDVAPRDHEKDRS